MKKNKEILWNPVSSNELLKTRAFTVLEKKSISPAGTERKFISLHAPSWAVVIPYYKDADGEEFFIMVEQWRHGSEDVFIEFPGGVTEKNETPIESARRELLEETGFSASSIKSLGALSPNPAIMENQVHIFLAEVNGKEEQQKLDDDEFVNVLHQPVKKVIRKMGSAPYTHSIMNAALFLFLREKILQGNTVF